MGLWMPPHCFSEERVQGAPLLIELSNAYFLNSLTPVASWAEIVETTPRGAWHGYLGIGISPYRAGFLAWKLAGRDARPSRSCRGTFGRGSSFVGAVGGETPQEPCSSGRCIDGNHGNHFDRSKPSLSPGALAACEVAACSALNCLGFSSLYQNCGDAGGKSGNEAE